MAALSEADREELLRGGNSMKRFEAFCVRTIDIVVSLVTLLLASPLLALVSLLVKIDSRGPVLFCQARLGKNGRPFGCYKFRSMKVDAPDIRNEDGSAFNSIDDPRVTLVGDLLRRSSLDELPQFLNVLFGQMSLVGPRPDQVDQEHYYTARERKKLLVKPGITGLAQINGRNSISWDERKRLDVAYVQSKSILVDLHILLLTIPYVLLGRGIHINKQAQKSDEGSRA